jgi:hypothetical protein
MTASQRDSRPAQAEHATVILKFTASEAWDAHTGQPVGQPLTGH